jgi:S-(hydroxymethyl)glutathione dehydrogenase/alcohol dehydrogenase
VAPGDHAVIATLAACGMCEHCADGRPTAFRSTLVNWTKPSTLDGEQIFNFAATSAFVERTVVCDIQWLKIPKDVPRRSPR